jgi:hypothetical protein
MSSDSVLQEIIDLLRRRGRVTYRGLKRQFNLSEEALAGIKHELIKRRRAALDEEGEVLVWRGNNTTTPRERR